MKNMIKILFPICVIFLFGCRGEDDVEPANEKTFVRYLGTADNNTAVLALETSDGFALLSNVEREEAAEGFQGTRKIKFMRTDSYGHVYPGLAGEQDYPENGDWQAASFIELPNTNPGYLIIGESIKSNGLAELLLLQLSQDLTLVRSLTIKAPDTTASFHGRAVMIDKSSGNYLLLGSVTKDPALTENDMVVIMVDTNFSTVWTTEYGAGLSSTINRLYMNDSQNILWGGSVRNFQSSRYDVRLIKVPFQSPSSINGAPVGDPGYDEIAFDFCNTFGGWAFTGSMNENDLESIFVMKVSNDGIFLSKTSLEGSKGVSISATNDSGVVMLGEVNTTDKSTDLTLAKLNAFGDQVWQHRFGGADRQEAASVRQTSDRGYLVFGTTYFVNEKKLMLMKLDGNGEL